MTLKAPTLCLFFFHPVGSQHAFGRELTGDVAINATGSGTGALCDITKGQFPELCATARTPWEAEARRRDFSHFWTLSGLESRVIVGEVKVCIIWGPSDLNEQKKKLTAAAGGSSFLSVVIATSVSQSVRRRGLQLAPVRC